jgi:hypothetical protein
VGVGFGDGEGVGVGFLLMLTVVVTFFVVVIVVVTPCVMVCVAVPDFKMLLQKRSASDVWPTKASKPQSLTSGISLWRLSKAAASALAASAIANATDTFMIELCWDRLPDSWLDTTIDV